MATATTAKISQSWLPDPSTPALARKLHELEGEIINGRYVMLEPLGPGAGGHRYLAYDMERLVRFKAEVSLTSSGQAAVANIEAPPPIPAAPPPLPAPPPIPLTAGPPPAELAPPRARVQTRHLEAAWFARCSRLEQEQEAGEVEDYLACQADLEQEAATLTQERYQQFALEGPGCAAVAALPGLGSLRLPADEHLDLISQLRAFAFASRARSVAIGAGLGLLLASLLLL